MEFLKPFYDINYVLVEIGDYPLSPVELTGTFFGLISVWLAAKGDIRTWPTGLINVTAFFLIFYQVALYSDMLLQAFFFVMSIYGWRKWLKDKHEKQRKITADEIHVLGIKQKIFFAFILTAGVLLLGFLISNIHLTFPEIFPQAAAYPYADAFTTVASILATFWLARKILDSWYLWIAVDLVSIVLYIRKDILFIAGEYLIFLFLAGWGLYRWQKMMCHEGTGIR